MRNPVSPAFRLATPLLLVALGACGGSGGGPPTAFGHGGGGPGTSLELDALSSQWVDVGTSGIFEKTAHLTLEAWIKADPDQYNPFPRIIDKFNFYDAQGYNLILNGGRAFLEIFLSDASSRSVFGGTVLLDDQWHHVAGTYDGQLLRIYVDGVLDGEEDIGDVTIEASTNPLVLGGGNDGGGDLPFNGSLDEVRVWNVARTQAEIAVGAFTCLSGAEPGLLGYWRLDEGSGSTAFDLTVFANHGTLVNSPQWSGDAAFSCGGGGDWQDSGE